jgi:hypothetical protein
MAHRFRETRTNGPAHTRNSGASSEVSTGIMDKDRKEYVVRS